jgi:hypothetical protein
MNTSRKKSSFAVRFPVCERTSVHGLPEDTQMFKKNFRMWHLFDTISKLILFKISTFFLVFARSSWRNRKCLKFGRFCLEVVCPKDIWKEISMFTPLWHVVEALGKSVSDKRLVIRQGPMALRLRRFQTSSRVVLIDCHAQLAQA